ncbi:hypothetical protein WDW37_04520 [Bdellovibrionota bacterium FG-1]
MKPRNGSISYLVYLSMLASLLGAGSKAMALTMKEGGSNNGGTDRASTLPEVVSQWCRGSQVILDQARDEAAMQDLLQDSAGAVSLLMQGLEQALRAQLINPVEPKDSLTRQAIERGLRLGRALRAQADAQGDNLEGVKSFLLSYYSFVKYVSNEIDLPIFIPFHGCRARTEAGCNQFDEGAYERRFVEYARRQIQLYSDNFVLNAPASGGVETFPVHNGAQALKVLEFITQWAAEDLSQSLRSARYACAITDLMQINGKLAAFNGGNHAVYGGDVRYALNLASDKVNEVLALISNGCGK